VNRWLYFFAKIVERIKKCTLKHQQTHIIQLCVHLNNQNKTISHQYNANLKSPKTALYSGI